MIPILKLTWPRPLRLNRSDSTSSWKPHHWGYVLVAACVNGMRSELFSFFYIKFNSMVSMEVSWWC